MIDKIRQYFIDNEIIDENCRINIDFLGEKPTEFSIEKIPVNPILEQYTNGGSYRQFQFQLVSCNHYGADVIQNIANSEYYENLYNLIETNNEQGILPNITGIDTIECLNNGGVDVTDINTARYSIQMRITYYKEEV